MEPGGYVNAGKLKRLSSYKQLNLQELAKALQREPDLVSRLRNGKLPES
jgi:hypothetical protein